MTKRAGIEPLLSRHPAGIADIGALLFAGMGGVEADMRCSRSVTFLTIDAIQELPLVEEVAGLVPARKDRPRVGGMAFQALGWYGPVKDRGVARIAGALAPAVRRREIADGQLEQPLSLPVQIALSFPARTDHDGKGFAPPGPAIPEGRLKKAAVPVLHHHYFRWMIDKTVPAGFKASPDGFPCRGS